MRIAIAVNGDLELERCMAQALASAEPPTELAVVSIAKIRWLEGCGVLSGQVDMSALAAARACDARGVALAAMRLLPATVPGVYIVCTGWTDPGLRRFLARARFDQLIVVRNRWSGTRLARLAVRGTPAKLVTVDRRAANGATPARTPGAVQPAASARDSAIAANSRPPIIARFL